MKYLKIPVLLAFAFVLLFACRKEFSFEENGSQPGGNNGPYGWSFKGNTGAAYYGCVDTAFYDSQGGLTALNIEGTDSAGNGFVLIITSPSAIATGAYTVDQGATMLFADNSSFNTYTTTNTTSFTIKIITINDTLVEAEFSGEIVDPFSNNNFTVTEGTLKALIGKHTPCHDDGNGNGSTDAGFTLSGSPDTCLHATVQGIYVKEKDITVSNTVELEVDVHKTGDWNITTPVINGISFSGSGNFTNSGVQTIVLHGAGIPADSGLYQIPVTAGSSECRFALRVEEEEQLPCMLPENVVDMDGVATLGFTSGVHGSAGARSYTFTGNSPDGDLNLEFYGNTYPETGAYIIRPLSGSFVKGDVRVLITAQNLQWQSSDGLLQVIINYGKLTAVFCGVEFTAIKNSNTLHSFVSAHVTEK